MRKPYISVIVPLYNKVAIVERSVRSVLGQSFADFELIVVDDGSTDGSAEVVRGIHDSRIVFIQQENGGPSKARNTGVRHAKADWIVFLDADDELLPDALVHFAELSKSIPCVDIFDCTPYIRTKSDKQLIRKKTIGLVKNVMKACFYGEASPGSDSSMFKKALLSRFPYDTKLHRFEDGELLLRILPQAKVYSDDYPVAVINQEFSSASHPRKNVDEDYFGHLNFGVKGFWAKMCVYRTYIENRDYYPADARRLYPTLRYRYDYMLIYKMLMMLK